MFSRLARALAVCAAAAALFTIQLHPLASSQGVVINQVYGGGGNTGSVYTNDFIELLNTGDAPATLDGWSVQYASSAGTTWQSTPLSGTLGPGEYYLVQEAAGTGGTTALPTPNATGTIPMSATAGKVVLFAAATPIASGTSCPSGPSVIDSVGFGTANCFEGTGPSPAPSNTKAIARTGGADTDNNAADFTAVDPNPHSNVLVASGPSGSGSANPAAVAAGGSVLLTVTTVPGTNPTSTGIAVTSDLSGIGGGPAAGFFNDGTHGDLTAGDATYSLTATIGAGTSGGAKVLPVTITDAQGRSGAAAISLTVTVPPPPAADVVISQVYGGGGNSGATFKNDFIELFNREAHDVSMSGWSVQYASASGTSWQVTSLGGIIPAHGYYLVQEAAGSGGTMPLPEPDAIGSINMSGTSAKVALVNAGTAVSGTCPAAAIDLVGYGLANCFEGSAAVPLLANTTAALRKDDQIAGKQDTNDNANDFIVGVPSPRNHAGIVPQGTGAATPGAVEPGDTTLLTVAVTPGENPLSTALSVTADLSAVGGSPTQPLFDDGSNGDATAGDRTFSLLVTVTGTAGARTVPFVVSDAEGRSTPGTIPLAVLAPPIPIHTIQGSASESPLSGQFVTTTGVVTAVRTSSFYIQSRSEDADADPNTSEGLLVFGVNAPSLVQRGDYVRVAGIVTEFRPNADLASPSLTELEGPVFTKVIASGQSLPDPAVLTSAMVSPSGGFEQLERFEGMRVTGNFTAVSGTASFSRTTTDETQNTSTSNGQFFAVLSGTPRPLREPGIAPDENQPSSPPANLPRFDGDPERLRVDSSGQIGAGKIEIAAGQQLPNLTGVLDYGFRCYTVVPDPAPWMPIGSAAAVPVSNPLSNEFTVATFNAERFYDDVKDGYGEEVVLTHDAFHDRLAKASLTIRHQLKSPDLIGLEEVENINALTRLATQVNADALAETGVDPHYAAYLMEGHDIGGIDVGILVKSTRVSVEDVQQLGFDTMFPAGSQTFLNDRPSLFMKAFVAGPGGVMYPVTFVVNHLRSLSGIDDPSDGPRVRQKRAAQAEELARALQEHQAENVISVGDYNAFQFNDGWVDVVGTLVGTPAPADQVVQPTAGGLVAPPFTVLDNALGSQQYSFMFDGIGQALDHVLVDDAAKLRFTRIGYARTDADFPESLRSDATRPERISDHDQLVAYFSFPGAPSIALNGPADLTVECCSIFAAPSAADVTTHDDYPVAVTVSGDVDVHHVGTYTVTYTADNGFLTSSVTRTVHVVDTIAPIVTLNGSTQITVEAGMPFTDPGATAADTCTGDLSAGLVESGAVNTSVPGTYTLTYAVSDGFNTGSATRTVKVVDTTAPVISGIAATPNSLGTPNHLMIDVTVNFTATDVTGAPVCGLSVTSNEAIDGVGDGHTTVDWQVLSPHHVRLRAERDATGSGREYVITATCVDGSGNVAAAHTSVGVPK